MFIRPFPDESATGRDELPDARARKYNDPDNLNEFCRGFLNLNDTDRGAAIEYCRRFLTVMARKDLTAGAVLSSRSRYR